MSQNRYEVMFRWTLPLHERECPLSASFVVSLWGGGSQRVRTFSEMFGAIVLSKLSAVMSFYVQRRILRYGQMSQQNSFLMTSL